MKEREFFGAEKEEGKTYSGMDAAAYRSHLETGGFYEDVPPFEKAIEISKAIKDTGGRALLVGGGVRDELLGIPVKDFDLEVYNVAPEKLRELVGSFGDVNEVGMAFGILKLRVGETDLDISLPRRESKTGKGHKDFSVSADPNMSIKEAARRRDFTFNSLAKDILTGEIYDNFGGVEDLRNRILRVTDEERFKDDPLRVLRAVQFVGRMGLKIDDKSSEIIRSMRSELKYLPKERLREEWLKLFLRSPKPSLGLNAAMELGIFHEMHADEIIPLAQTPQEPEWHPEGDVWIHTMMVADEAKKIIDRERLRGDDATIITLASFCHDFGKPATTKITEGRIRSLEHEEKGMAPAVKFLSDIGIEASLREPIANLVRDHLKPGMLWRIEQKGEQVSDGAIRNLAKRLHPATIGQLVCVSEADNRGRGHLVDPNEPEKYLIPKDYPPKDWLLERARKINVEKSKPAPIIYGRDLIALGLEPGKIFGEIINLANSLRDERNFTKEEILELLYDNKGKKAEDLAEAIREKLKGK